MPERGDDTEGERRNADQGGTAAFSFGPISERPDLRPFDTISKKALLLADAYMEERPGELSLEQQVYYKLLRLGELTSAAILTTLSWNLVIPAMALARVRLEQVIVSSYLIHEDRRIGLHPYMEFPAVSDYLFLKSASADADMGPYLGEFNLDAVRRQAAEAMSRVGPAMDAEEDDFRTKWTSLSVPDLARRRDELTRSLGPISSIRLALAYSSAYKVFSGVVHADAVSISPAFLGTVGFRSGRSPVNVPNETWLDILYQHNAIYDVTQTYETMTVLGIACGETFGALLADWHAALRQSAKLWGVDHPPTPHAG